MQVAVVGLRFQLALLELAARAVVVMAATHQTHLRLAGQILVAVVAVEETIRRTLLATGARVLSSSVIPTLLLLLLQPLDHRQSPFLVASAFTDGPHQGA
jgi:hypothetical protein